MFVIKLANHNFLIKNKYSYVENLCQDYRVNKYAEKIIEVSEQEIDFENKDGRNWSSAYLESLAIYRKICECLLEDDIVLFHCSALAIDGRAYLFTAPSGTGKSTHARLWRERFGKRVTMINDDKPLVSLGKGEIVVYGTPYGGKEHLQTNCSAEVAGIVILHQNTKNTVRFMTGGEAYPILLNQTYRRKDPQGIIKTLELVKKLSLLPIYSVGCTISMEAVEIAYNALMEGEK